MRSLLKSLRGGRRRGARSGLVACLLLLAASAAVTQQERPPFEFVEPGALAFKPGAANEVWVLNNTTKPLTLAVTLVDSNGAEGKGLSSFVEATPNPLPLPKASGAKLTLSMKQGVTLEPSSPLSAYLVISDEVSGRVLRRPVSIDAQPKTSGSPPPTPPDSMVATLKATAYCWPLRGSCEVVLDEPLPLDKPMGHEDLAKVFKEGATLTRLSTGSGDTALVTYEGDVQKLAGGTAGVKLGFKSSGTPGDYTGKLPDIKSAAENQADKKPVALTVASKHHVLCAALAILVGILVYYLMQWYINVLRKVSVLAQQEAELEAAFDEAEQHFRETAAGRDYQDDSVQVEFKRQAGDLLTEIKELRFSNFIRLDESSPAFKAVIAKLDALGEVVKKWGAFAESKLNPLEDALDAGDPDSAHRPPGIPEDGKTPAVTFEARALLAASGEMSIAGFDARAVKADELAPRLASWRRLNEEAQRVRERFRGIIADTAGFGTLDPLTQQDIKAKQEQALLIWSRLWTRGDFDPVQVRGSLRDLEDSLAVLDGQNPPAVAAVVAAMPPGVAAAGEDSPAARAERIGQVRLSLDVLNFVLTLAVAVYAAVATFYFNQPWGTARDYVAALVTGFSAKPVIDTVISVLSRFMSRTP